jgi:hypothetical protein
MTELVGSTDTCGVRTELVRLVGAPDAAAPVLGVSDIQR